MSIYKLLLLLLKLVYNAKCVQMYKHFPYLIDYKAKQKSIS